MKKIFCDLSKQASKPTGAIINGGILRILEPTKTYGRTLPFATLYWHFYFGSLLDHRIKSTEQNSSSALLKKVSFDTFFVLEVR